MVEVQVLSLHYMSKQASLKGRYVFLPVRFVGPHGVRQLSEMGVSKLPHKTKHVYFTLLNHTPSTFFWIGKFLKKAEDQCPSIAEESIYYVKHNVHTTF